MITVVYFTSIYRFPTSTTAGTNRSWWFRRSVCRVFRSTICGVKKIYSGGLEFHFVDEEVKTFASVSCCLLLDLHLRQFCLAESYVTQTSFVLWASARAIPIIS